MAKDPQRRLYHYEPSKAAAIVFTILFLITSAAHIYQSLIHKRRRAWFMIPFLIGGLMELFGYLFRIKSADDQTAISPYVVQTLLILLAPALMAASIYMILSRIIEVTDAEKYALVRRKWLTTIFVSGDVLSIITQGFGGTLLTNTKGTPKELADRTKLGKNVILVGLFIQIVFFGFFILVSALFQLRGREHFTKLPTRLTWRKHMYTLYFVSFLILVRSIFRVAEYVQGVDGYLYTHEVFLYIFDAALMFIAMLSMNVVHPAEIASLLKARGGWENEADMVRLESRA
ncbi:RTA1 like protein [Periconia macrospinosa]|uniref:RTA1 like protein n=1 Tax=Periconia macrospinosa TaxID=97972 RepID=A0A2V1EEB3_9PLEO|nr:RTA1 like protein [Periconia macrospinosa]